MIDRAFSLLRFSAYARDLSEAVAALSRESQSMRSISDYLHVRLRDLGLPEITDQQLSGGLQVISFGDGTRISVGPFASDTEIERAARAAFAKPLEHALTEINPSVASPVAATADRMPPVDLAKPADTGPKMGPVSRGYSPGALKALLAGVRTRTADVMAEAVKEVGELNGVLDQVQSIAQDARDTKDQIRAELGQFSNDLA